MDKSSPWRREKKPFEFAPLIGPLKADVAIVGGGLTGIIAAYLLRDNGLSIAVAEAETIGSRASGSTTAFLMELIDTSADELVSTHGEIIAKKILDSHKDAIDFYGRISKEERIGDFKRVSFYAYASDHSQIEDRQKEITALAKLGRNVSWHTDEALGFLNQGYFSLPNQAKIHPLKFLYGLTQVVSQSGTRIYEHTELKPNLIEAKWTLWATQYPPKPQPAKLFFKKAAYLTFVVEAQLPANTLPEGLFEDAENPYHYLRVDKEEGRDRLLLGGADHRMDIKIPEDKAYAALQKYLHKILPDISYEIVRQWKGMIVEPGDGLALFGPIGDPAVFYATGHSGNGLTYAVIAAQMFCDYVLGKHNDLAHIYAADRPTHLAAHLKGAWRYLGEFVHGVGENLSSQFKEIEKEPLHSGAAQSRLLFANGWGEPGISRVEFFLIAPDAVLIRL